MEPTHEWVPSLVFDELNVNEIARLSAVVSAKYVQWTSNLGGRASADRDNTVRAIMTSSCKDCLNMDRRYPRRFAQLTNFELFSDPIMLRHQNAMLGIFQKLQLGEISKMEAQSLVARLAERTIRDKTDSLPPEVRARMVREREAEREKSA
jgi:hypothetical protein